MADFAKINNTLGKMEKYLSCHNSICVGVSGGSDSTIIVHMIATYFRQYLNKVHFVFVDTGLEYNVTKKFIAELEERYCINIDRVKGEPIPIVVKKNGVPILSKKFSHVAEAYTRDVPFALKFIDGEGLPNKSLYNLSRKQKDLAAAIKNRGVKISDKCCDLSKKKPLKQYQKRINCDLIINGERQMEGGMRAIIHTSCFVPKKSEKATDLFLPLFFWDDDTKRRIKKRKELDILIVTRFGV